MMLLVGVYYANLSCEQDMYIEHDLLGEAFFAYRIEQQTMLFATIKHKKRVSKIKIDKESI